MIEYNWNSSGRNATVVCDGKIVGWISATSQWDAPGWRFQFEDNDRYSIGNERLAKLKEFIEASFKEVGVI